MERKLTKVVDGTEITVGGKMCSCGTDVANDLCSWECPDTCRNSCLTFQGNGRQQKSEGGLLSGGYGFI